MLQGFQALGALLLVLGVAVVGVSILKAWTVRAGVRRRSLQVPVEIVGGTSLGDGRSLLVVEVEGDRFLLGLSRNRVDLLSRLSAAKRGEETRGRSEGTHEA
jgi:flagellar biogenesis protein FliO